MLGRCPIPRGSDIVVVLDSFISHEPNQSNWKNIDDIVNELIRECHVVNVVSADHLSKNLGDDDELFSTLQREAAELSAVVLFVVQPGRRTSLTTRKQDTVSVFIYVLPAKLFNDEVRYTRYLVLALVHAEIVSLLRFDQPIFGKLIAPVTPGLVAA